MPLVDFREITSDVITGEPSATHGKQRMTDVAGTEQLLRIIQSIPSPKAEPFKRWLAKAPTNGCRK